MNLLKAIEILEYHEPSLTYDENPDIRLALQLGLEALKRELIERQPFTWNSRRQLSGETKD